MPRPASSGIFPRESLDFMTGVGGSPLRPTLPLLLTCIVIETWGWGLSVVPNASPFSLSLVVTLSTRYLNRQFWKSFVSFQRAIRCSHLALLLCLVLHCAGSLSGSKSYSDPSGRLFLLDWSLKHSLPRVLGFVEVLWAGIQQARALPTSLALILVSEVDSVLEPGDCLLRGPPVREESTGIKSHFSRQALQISFALCFWGFRARCPRAYL